MSRDALTQLNLEQWLAQIEALHPTEIELGLERVRLVAERLELPQLLSGSLVITIAGTNGKGSCVASLEALLAQHPRKPTVGAFTSPHFLDYNERIRIGGQAVTDAEICAAFAAIEVARGEISLSYFEFGTLAALYIFAHAKVQFVLLEVGLGGRLDAVNIIDPDVAILTSVALDHQDWLGDNLEQIATEKAGVFRPGRPALCAMFEPPAAVADSARRLGSQLYQAGEDFNWQRLDNGGWQIQLQQQSLQLPALTLPLPSVVAALQTLEILKLLPAEQDCQRALSGLILRGRCQPMEFAGRRWVLDVAHNPAASEHLLQQLAWTAGGSARRQLIVAMMADKEAAEIMAPWLGRAARVYACELANNPRAISAKNLYSVLQRQGFAAEVADSVASAMETALAASAEGDEILIMGSFFTVAAALAYFSEQGCSVQ